MTATMTGPRATASPSAPVPAFAWRPVAVVAALVAAVHLAVAGRPGWWLDEALMVTIGRHHLDWGSADQPPFAPLLTRLVDLIAPDSLLVHRLPAIAATAAAVVVAALIARELGGDGRAQWLTAAALGTGTWLAFAGHWVTPYTLETPEWLVLFWLLVRWRRVRDDRLLLVFGVVLGVAAQTKFQVLLLAAVLLVSVAVLGPRELLRRPKLWVGAAIALVVAAPTLIWQAVYGWPQLRMGPIVAAEAAYLYAGRPGVMVSMLWFAGVMGLVLLLYGLWRLVRDPELRDLRYLAATAVVLYAFFSITVGRPYYLAGMYGVLIAVGAVGLARRRAAGHRRWRWVAWPALLVSTAAAAGMLALSVGATAPEVGASVTTATVRAYDALPPAQRARTTVMAESYVYAALIDVNAPRGALPPAASSNRSYGYFTPPGDDQDTVLYVGSTADELRPWFTDVRPVADAGTDAHVWLATGRLVPWSQFWPSLRHLDVS